jgi:hypothetical protein
MWVNRQRQFLDNAIAVAKDLQQWWNADFTPPKNK